MAEYHKQDTAHSYKRRKQKSYKQRKITAALCFTGVISLVQLRLGNFSPKNSEESDKKHIHSRTTSSDSKNSTAENPADTSRHSIQITAGTPVSIIWSDSLALSTCHGVTGSDCSSQSVLPSSETDGAAISFIVHTKHTTATGKNSAASLPSPKAYAKTDNVDSP